MGNTSWVGTFASVAGALAVGFASPAIAQPSLTQAESDFIGAVAQQGYAYDVYGTVRTGHRVCELLDDGVSTSAIQRFVTDSFRDPRPQAGYYAALFGTYSAYHLCPRHIGEFGNI